MITIDDHEEVERTFAAGIGVLGVRAVVDDGDRGLAERSGEHRGECGGVGGGRIVEPGGELGPERGISEPKRLRAHRQRIGMGMR